MPELPEVEAVRRVLQPVLEGARIERVTVRRPKLRLPIPPDFARRLEGQIVRRLDRRGKYLLAEITSGDVLLMHLGMSGSFRIESNDVAPGPHDHVMFGLSSQATVIFNDPRRFGLMDLIACDQISRYASLIALGPEPLDAAFDATALARGCRGRKTPLKVALSDQRLVAGLGNIYVSEALHRARLSPHRRAASIATRNGEPRDSTHRLVAAIKGVLNDAISRSVAWQTKQGDALADPAYFPYRLRVYDREGARCLRRGCTGRIRRIVQGGRSTFFCGVCQR